MGGHDARGVSGGAGPAAGSGSRDSGSNEWSTALTQAAGFLRDLPAAWDAATPEQRNDLARLIFESIEIKDDRVIAVVPQPDFAPFFVDRLRRENGGNGNTPEGSGGVNREIEEAEATGFEPAISALTGLHVRPLHHASSVSQDTNRVS